MLLKRNLLETVTLACSCATFLCILLNYATNISPITGMWFLIYILLLIIVSLVLSIKIIQWLLHLNKPLRYDLDHLAKEYPLLSFLRDVLPEVKTREKRECKDYDTNELSVISTVLEKKLVSSWYVPYISEEIGFPFACKQLLDQMINKTFQICHKIETKDFYVDMCAILITHIKEYKKALKRHEKSPSSTVESLYKKSHAIFDPVSKLSSADHCVNILRIILKELVPWELWDTPHSELLIRVLAKKLDNFIDSTLSEPAWLNDKLFTILEKKREMEEDVKEHETENVENESVKEKTEPITKEEEITVKEPVAPPVTSLDPIPTPKVKPALLPQKVTNDEAQEVVEEVANGVEEATAGSEPLEIKPSAVLRQRRGRQGRNEVKIYDRIIEGSVKTWETDMDLQCISVGQDLLASLDEMTLSRLWGQEDAEHSPNLRNRSPQPLWFGEEDSIDIDHPEPDTKEVKKDSSPKPTEALLKDIQSTVHQAKTKIGDLQVPLDIDVPCKHSSDEAAGMMEGLLDIGIAGLKKGLRFTGLSDDTQDKSPHHKNDKTSPPDSARSHMKTASEPKDSPQLQKEENGNSVPPLVKQQRVISQDSVPHPPQSIPIRGEPPPLPLSDSPEPEYEEVADLSTSIAKLRSLLQETGNVNRSDDIWWEGAEETRGRTHHGQHYSYSRPVDTATLADEYDMSGEPNSSPRQASNNMQRLFQRTVTGVFNSLRTAVSADAELRPSAAPAAAAAWTYIGANSADNSVGSSVARLLGARRGVWQVDAALDSLHHLPTPPLHPHPPPPEDFEEWMASECKAWSAACDLASACGLARRHVPCRLAALLAADLGETLISSWLDDLTWWLRAQIFVLFRQMSQQDRGPDLGTDRLREFNLDETCRMLVERIPHVYMFGEDSVSEAVRLAARSLSHKPLNRQLVFRALDLFAAHFKRCAALRNPSFDNN